MSGSCVKGYWTALGIVAVLPIGAAERTMPFAYGDVAHVADGQMMRDRGPDSDARGRDEAPSSPTTLPAVVMTGGAGGSIAGNSSIGGNEANPSGPGISSETLPIQTRPANWLRWHWLPMIVGAVSAIPVICDAVGLVRHMYRRASARLNRDEVQGAERREWSGEGGIDGTGFGAHADRSGSQQSLAQNAPKRSVVDRLICGSLTGYLDGSGGGKLHESIAARQLNSAPDYVHVVTAQRSHELCEVCGSEMPGGSQEHGTALGSGKVCGKGREPAQRPVAPKQQPQPVLPQLQPALPQQSFHMAPQQQHVKPPKYLIERCKKPGQSGPSARLKSGYVHVDMKSSRALNDMSGCLAGRTAHDSYIDGPFSDLQSRLDSASWILSKRARTHQLYLYDRRTCKVWPANPKANIAAYMKNNPYATIAVYVKPLGQANEEPKEASEKSNPERARLKPLRQ